MLKNKKDTKDCLILNLLSTIKKKSSSIRHSFISYNFYKTVECLENQDNTNR